jgi:hypothetical protein
MYLHVGRVSNRTGPDQITVRVAKGKSVSASGAGHTACQSDITAVDGSGQDRSFQVDPIQLVAGHPSPSQASAEDSQSVQVCAACRPQTGDEVALCIVDVGLHESNRSTRSTRKGYPSMVSEAADLTPQAYSIQDEIRQFASMGLDERTQPRVRAALLKPAFDQPHKMLHHDKLPRRAVKSANDIDAISGKACCAKGQACRRPRKCCHRHLRPLFRWRAAPSHRSG